MCAGVSKSGSPAPRLITSLPCCRRRAARALTASVGEGLTRWTRRATGKVTEFPAFRLRSGSPAILRDCVRPGHRESIRVEQQPFKLEADYAPAGDQPQAIEKLVEGLAEGLAHQTLLGVTGSGKTYSAAAVIQRVQRPTMVLAHNKTLAAQLYGEFREFFPHNAVEYFVSYYDYYQPEAYVPSSDTYIEKDASVNEHIEQMRLSATKALLERSDSIIVATASTSARSCAASPRCSTRATSSISRRAPTGCAATSSTSSRRNPSARRYGSSSSTTPSTPSRSSIRSPELSAARCRASRSIRAPITSRRAIGWWARSTGSATTCACACRSCGRRGGWSRHSGSSSAPASTSR